VVKTLIHHATLYARGGVYDPGWLLVEEGRIAAIGRGAAPQDTDARELDAQGRIVAPGLVDLHAHGALGHDTMDANPEALREMARFYARHGVTAFLATTMSAPAADILAALWNIAEVMRLGTGGAALLGAHVEGPYLDVERRGCQDAALVRGADPAEYGPMLDTGVVRLLTLAPEIPANRPLIRYAVERGVTVAIGHTRASYDEVCRAVDLGATQVTHLFNAMDPLHHREPGAVGAALTLDALSCQLIADNIHIHPAVLNLALCAKGPERIILVTDAMGGTGMPDGEYTLGGLAVTVREGVARIASGSLAGSTLTLERAVRHIMAAGQVSLYEALSMASSTPARALGLTRKGAIAVGMDADLILLDESANVLMTMVCGEIVHEGASASDGARK